MTCLRKRKIDDMAARRLAEFTIRSYLNFASGLAGRYGRNPGRISAQEVQEHLLHLHWQRGLSREKRIVPNSVSSSMPPGSGAIGCRGAAFHIKRSFSSWTSDAKPPPNAGTFEET